MINSSPQVSFLVSIIIPAHNVENYIEECVHSAFAQTYPHIEVICIDNNSTDQTWQKLEQLKQQYPKLIIDKELKPGAPAARNKGLKLSKGEWLQFLDADDLLLPSKIEHQLNILKTLQKNDVSFIAAACLTKDLKGNENKGWLHKDAPFKSLFNKKLGNTCANLWNRQYIEKINGWNETIKSSQEADLMFRLLQQNEQVIFDEEPLTIVRERPEGQISQSNYTEKWTRYFKRRIEIKNWLESNKPAFFQEEKDFFNDYLFGILRVIAMEDISAANRLFIKYMKGNHKPSVNQGHSNKIYLLLFKLFGFRAAEIFKKIWSKIKN